MSPKSAVCNVLVFRFQSKAAEKKPEAGKLPAAPIELGPANEERASPPEDRRAAAAYSPRLIREAL